jgi:hypothetical protein
VNSATFEHPCCATYTRSPTSANPLYANVVSLWSTSPVSADTAWIPRSSET